ncbi:hypothetical protein N0V93_000422 [Gnomoniopsis smithogilvyi]|uniref:Formate/nitrite transporter n=1 Tax=Gnomoniopsis smithogilvyi TaxID=1191159 RepID=A0A9W8Z1X0_9PEZI|nr:hypothetical protein N0V93_000422 [Gnomoniopsis smithogilvyi]
MSSYSVPYGQQVHFENPRVLPSATTSSLTLNKRDHATAVHVNVACYTAAETIELISQAGELKGAMRPEKTFFSAVSAGCLLAFAAAANLRAQASPWLIDNAPGLNGLIGAMVFPMGLVWIVLTGAELFTDVIMYTIVAALQGKLKLWQLARQWFLCFWGNLAGTLFVMIVILGYGGVFQEEPFFSTMQAAATNKQLLPTWYQIFLRGIGCNWLVCLACFHGMQGKDLVSKTVGIWWPMFAFTHLGLDHVVANMSYIPMGIFLGTPKLTVGLYVLKGVIPVLFGNILGGGLFVGTYYWWMYLCGSSDLTADATLSETDTKLPTKLELRRGYEHA